jgi:tRNA pseudouridine38-40 synthase
MIRSSYFAVLQYDGNHFAGWQRQPDTRTVQGEFEAALARLEGHRVPAHAAGRTDAGVHALGQVVSFTSARTWDPDDLRRALNANTPRDIWVAEAGSAPQGFHARKDATARRYRYVVGCDEASASPFRRPFEWDLRAPLERSMLDAAAACFTGEHDFRALSTVGQPKPHYRCVVRTSEWQKRTDHDGFIFTIEADRFLHRMVRFLVGIMVDVGRGRRPLDDIPRLLTRHGNEEASPPAPPQGLYFVYARYPQLQLGHRT